MCYVAILLSTTCLLQQLQIRRVQCIFILILTPLACQNRWLQRCGSAKPPNEEAGFLTRWSLYEGQLIRRTGAH